MSLRRLPVVPVMRPRLSPLSAAQARLLAVEQSGQFSNFGPQERELRGRFAQRLGVDPNQVATVSNATLGIAGAVSVLGGERWLVPSFTFAATPAAVLAAGREVVLGDIGQDWILAPEGEQVDGYAPVAPFGAPPDLARWAESRRVVHDAAASLGNELDLSALPAGHAVVFSLHVTKVLGSGEGGIVVFGEASDANRFRAWTNFGFSESREAQVPGLSAKISEIQACYVHASLDGWDVERAEWADARHRVVEVAAQTGLRLFEASQDGINPYAIAVFDDDSTALEVERVLEERGIGTRRWWMHGCHRMPAYAHLAGREFPVTARVAATSLGLPLYRGMADEDLQAVSEGLAQIVGPI